MGLMTIASQVRWSGKKGMPTLTEIEIPTIVHSKAEMNIGLLKPVKTFSRDGHGTLEKQFKAFSRDGHHGTLKNCKTFKTVKNKSSTLEILEGWRSVG